MKTTPAHVPGAPSISGSLWKRRPKSRRAREGGRAGRGYCSAASIKPTGLPVVGGFSQTVSAFRRAEGPLSSQRQVRRWKEFQLTPDCLNDHSVIGYVNRLFDAYDDRRPECTPRLLESSVSDGTQGRSLMQP